MFAPIDFTRIEAALASPAGWWELAIVAVCFAIGWMLDRRLRLESASEAEVVRLGLGSVNRMLLPLATLALMLVAAAVFQRWHPPFFLPIAIPLMVALALIRLIVYAMHELFGAPAWLPWSERVVSFAIWGIVLLHFTGVLPELWADLDALDIPIGAKHVSVLELLKGSVVLILTIAGCLWLSGLIEQRLQKAAKLDSSVRVVISKFVRALLLAVGMLVALQAVGIDLTLLTVFGGALGVGIGLGLQKLASNYIAGFTILLDRSIRLGDVITVDNRFGVVAKVTSRYVIVRSFDGVEAVVPNETLVTTTSSTIPTRIAKSGMAVTGAGELRHRHRAGAEADGSGGHGRAARGEGPPNAPAAFLARFAEGGIELELGVWINDPGQQPAQPAKLDQAAIWKIVSRERHQDPCAAARGCA